ncbi:hypothetical protein DV737_g2017, partial [Chaetothyriales sp. CBS 132003]
MSEKAAKISKNLSPICNLPNQACAPANIFQIIGEKKGRSPLSMAIDPSTGKTALSVKEAFVSDVDAAVNAARKTYEGPWSELTPVDRGDFLRPLAGLIDRDHKLIAAINAYDYGKPYLVALEADLDESYSVLKYYAGWADKIYGDTIDTSPAKLAHTIQEPLGAVKWAHVGIMDNPGQVCMSTFRIYVHEKVYADFVKAFVEFTKKSTAIGSPFKEDVNHGPQVSENQFDRILSYIEAGRKEGAKILSDGAKVECEGYYIEATVFVEASDSASITREDIFGPVVVISKFGTGAEAVAKANDTSYGLAAAGFTEKISRGHRVARKLQAGKVWINSSGDSHFGIPFGGCKSSQEAASAPCLSRGEAYNIGLRWLQIFQADEKGVGTGSAIIPSTLAKNFTRFFALQYYDEGASLGDPSPVYKSSDDVLQSVTGSGYSGALVTNVTYSIIEAFSSTVPVGTSISYRGTDYLRVDLETRLIYNATSSSDLVNYYIQLKDDVIKARAQEVLRCELGGWT